MEDKKKMKITINVSGSVSTRTNKKKPLEYGKFYIKPINGRGMEPYAEFEGTEEQVEKQVRAFLGKCVVKPSSRTQRYISRSGEKECYFLTLDSYKILAAYMRKFGDLI